MQKIIIGLVVLVLLGAGGWYLFSEQGDVDFLDYEEDVAKEEEEELMSLLGQVENIDSVRYELSIEANGESVATGTFWQKGEKIKMDGEMEGHEGATIIDNEEKIAYVYLPDQNVATKIPLSEVEEVQSSSVKNQSKELPGNNPVVVGKEVLKGRECLVVEYSSGEDMEGKMWIWKNHGIPVKTEVTTDTETTIIEAEDIDFSDIPDDVFELPEAVQLMEMPAL